MENGKWKLDVGTAFSMERIAGEIIVYEGFEKASSNDPATIKNGYAVNNLEAPIYLKYFFNKQFQINLGVSPQLRFYQNQTFNEELQKFDIRLNGVESYVGFGYEINRLNINLGYRWFNYRSLDLVLYPKFDVSYSLISVGRNKYYNPTHLRLLLGYKLF